MQLPPIIKQLEQRLEGEPDNVLTLILLLIAAFTVIVALSGNPLVKAVVAAWFIAP
jgi:hypothetical protein